MWPYEMYSSYHQNRGKHLLYLVSANVTNGGHCTFPDKLLPNGLHLLPNGFQLKTPRSKREAIITSKEVKEDGKTLNIVLLVGDFGLSSTRTISNNSFFFPQ